MPINATSLAHYFGGACILPSCYYTNKPEDLQDRFNGLLLLSTHLGTKQTNCCLEIVLDEEERDDLIDVKNGWYLYEKPIPISRVKQILFTNKEQKDTTITNIRLGTAFIPENIISIVNTFESVDVSNVVCPGDIVINDLSVKQKTFDKILGGLAVMKVAHPVYMNYSENYFSTLSHFNRVIFNCLIDANVRINDKLQPILDTKIEIEEEQADTIMRYKEQLEVQHAEEVAKKQAEIDSLMQQLKDAKGDDIIGVQYNRIVGCGMLQSKLEGPKEDSVSQNISKKQKIELIKEAFALRDLKKEGLIRRGQELNITFSKKEKIDDMVIKIMTSHIDDPKIF